MGSCRSTSVKMCRMMVPPLTFPRLISIPSVWFLLSLQPDMCSTQDAFSPRMLLLTPLSTDSSQGTAALAQASAVRLTHMPPTLCGARGRTQLRRARGQILFCSEQSGGPKALYDPSPQRSDPQPSC